MKILTWEKGEPKPRFAKPCQIFLTWESPALNSSWLCLRPSFLLAGHGGVYDGNGDRGGDSDGDGDGDCDDVKVDGGNGDDGDGGSTPPIVPDINNPGRGVSAAWEPS